MNADKIVELSDSDEYGSLSEELSEDEVEDQLKFKKSILKNKSIFKKQLLETTDFDQAEVFETRPQQENEGEIKDLYAKMDQQILDSFTGDEDVENKLLILSNQMTSLPGIDGVFKKLCKTGDQGCCPPEDSIVTIHYNGYIQDEISNQIKSFDSTLLRGKPKSFMRGQGLVIEGLDFAVGSMKKNEESEFIIAPDLAWGDKGCPPRIPANAYVYFKIHLMDWVDSSAAEAFGKLPMKMRKELPFQQVLDAAKSEKRKGTAHFEKQSFHVALKCYRRALAWIEDHGYADEEEENLGLALSLTLHLDLALVNLKINRPKKTCIHCKEALNISPENPKALYRFGLAQEKLGNYDGARSMLLKAKHILPKDSSIAKALIVLNDKVKKEKYIETDLARKMLGSHLNTDKTSQQFLPTEESQKIILRQLSEFVNNPNETHLDFPQGMAESERAFLEAEARRLNLKFSKKPIKGEHVCTVSKY